MSRTHNVIIPPIEFSHLETELAAWREVAGDLHAALAASAPGVFPGCGDSAIRSAALEAYARLKTSTLHAPDSTLSHEL